MHQAIARRVERGHDVAARCARARCAAARRTGGGSDTTRPAGRAAPRSRSRARASRACAPTASSASTASHRPPHMRSSTEVCLRNRASAGGSRDRSSRRKYSDTNRSSPLKLVGARRARRPGLQRQRREVQAGRPALRPLGQLGQLARVELDARGLQQQPGLLLVQPEVRHADLVHPSLRPPAGQRQRRLLPARDRDLRARRDVLEQRREHVQTGRIGDGVQIVEHQHQRALERRQRAPDARDARRPGRSARARTARRTPRAGPARRGGSRPRCSAGTRRRRRPGRRARPTRTDADPPRPTARAASSCRTRPARPRSRTARATRTAARSRPPSPRCRAESAARRA